MAALPDKWVRKAIYEAINNMVVDTKVIPCFDMRATGYSGTEYVILSTQTNTQTDTKCGSGWESSILLDVFTKYRKNSGNRLLADNISDAILTNLNGLQLDVASGMVINNITINFPSDITSEVDGEIIHRKLIRYELEIN